MGNRNLQPLQFKTEGLPPGLNIRYRPDSENPIRQGKIRTGAAETQHNIGGPTPIYTNQPTYDPKTVQQYRKSGQFYSQENDTDMPYLHEADGNLWHADGLHRMIAARLNKTSFPAEINWAKNDSIGYDY